MTDVSNTLEHVAERYCASDGILDGWRSIHASLVRYRFLTLRPWVQHRSILELGTADGEMTRHFLPEAKDVTCVEGARHFVDMCERTFADDIARGALRVEHALFETFQPQRRWETVIASHILEHLDHPVEMLKRFAGWVQPGGHLLVAVPNALSLHRQAAVEMGMLDAPTSLNPQDIQLGHRRVYTPEALRAHLSAAGLEVRELRGVLLKPLANRQMEGIWTQDMLDGFYALGQRMPEICAEMVAVCQVKNP